MLSQGRIPAMAGVRGENISFMLTRHKEAYALASPPPEEEKPLQSLPR